MVACNKYTRHKNKILHFWLQIIHQLEQFFSFIEETENYDIAIETLKQMFVKPKNMIFARHILATRTQNP